jgi:hypothetical protein
MPTTIEQRADPVERRCPVKQSAPRVLGYTPEGEKVAMTLQVVLGGKDGVVIGTDTKAMFSPFGPILGGPERRALELGKVRSGEYGAAKVLFNSDRAVAALCSGSDVTSHVGRTIIETIASVWNEYLGPVESLCREAWRTKLSDEERRAASERTPTLIFVHSCMTAALKIRFKADDLEFFVFHRDKLQKFIVLGGDDMNPSGMLLERYLPREAQSIDKLVLFAAHYILVGGELNPAGVEGLRLYFSREGRPFRDIPTDTMEELLASSKRLNRYTQRALLRPVNLDILRD